MESRVNSYRISNLSTTLNIYIYCRHKIGFFKTAGHYIDQRPSTERNTLALTAAIWSRSSMLGFAYIIIRFPRTTNFDRTKQLSVDRNERVSRWIALLSRQIQRFGKKKNLLSIETFNQKNSMVKVEYHHVMLSFFVKILFNQAIDLFDATFFDIHAHEDLYRREYPSNTFSISEYLINVHRCFDENVCLQKQTRAIQCIDLVPARWILLISARTWLLQWSPEEEAMGCCWALCGFQVKNMPTADPGRS